MDAFWITTIECLVRYHGLTHAEASSGVAAFRHRIAQFPVPRPDEMVYHDEPFNVACEIARQELDRFVPEVAEEYDRMLDRPFPVLDEVDAVAVHETGPEYRTQR